MVICGVAVGVGTALLYVSPPKSFYDMDINNLSLIEQVNQNAKIWTAAKQPAFDGSPRALLAPPVQSPWIQRDFDACWLLIIEFLK